MYLNLKDLVKVFPPRGGSKEVTAVNHIDLEIEQGELVTLLGPSGCGKTTTLRMIAGFEFPTSGDIFLDGNSINILPPHQRQMSMVFQSYAIFPHLNVYENVAYGLNVQHVPKQEIERRTAEVLELVQLVGYEKRAPNQLSGGQQQRVALARALVMQPKVLLLDEPLSNLDAKLREQMRTEIRRIQKSIDITSVYVTHDQIEAMTLSDRIVIMNNGIIEQVGTPSEVYRHPSTRFVADFIGRANFIEGRMVEQRGDMLVVEAFGQPLHVPFVGTSSKPGSAVTLVLRPESARLHSADPANGHTWIGTIHRATYLGNAVDYEVKIGEQIVTIQDTDPQREMVFADGEKVGVQALAGCLHVLVE